MLGSGRNITLKINLQSLGINSPDDLLETVSRVVTPRVVRPATESTSILKSFKQMQNETKQDFTKLSRGNGAMNNALPRCAGDPGSNLVVGKGKLKGVQ